MPCQIISDAIANVDSDIHGRLSKDALRKMIQKTRNRNAAVPPAPLRFEELVILILAH